MKNKIIAIIIGIAMVLAGIFTLMRPMITLYILTVILGSFMLLRGIFLLMRYFRIKKAGLPMFFLTTVDFVIGIIISVMGAIFIINPEFARDAFTYIVAIWFIIDALRSLTSLKPIRVVSEKLYISSLVMGILLLFAGIFLFINPWSLSLPIGILLGISLVISGGNLIIKGLGMRSDKKDNLNHDNREDSINYIEGEMAEKDDKVD